jgi:DNA-binding CsgD family transcriptional regulator
MNEKKKWEAILVSEGLKVISRAQTPRSKNSYWSIVNYSALVREHLEFGYFKTDLERQIWVCHADGLTVHETALRLDIKPARAWRHIKKLRVRFGLPGVITSHRPRPPREIDRVIKDLRAQKLTYRAIGEMLGMKRYSVRDRIRKLNGKR